MGGVGALEFLDDLGFGQAVDFRGEVHALLLDDVESVDAIHVTQDDVSCGARGAHRDINGGSWHGFGFQKNGVSAAESSRDMAAGQAGGRRDV
ncbi:hypothetical protein GCM10027021_17500 [Dyella kyungheensis]